MILYVTESKMTVPSIWDRASHAVPDDQNRGTGFAPSTGNRNPYPVLSYREALRVREPRSVDERCPGGAFGCPGDYFRGAPAADCRPLIKRQCDVCWAVEYKDEEWIENDER